MAEVDPLAVRLSAGLAALQAFGAPSPLRYLLRRSTRRLRDGTIGYYARPDHTRDYRRPRGDDCWVAAVATVLQVPIDELPDTRIDERVQAGEDPADVNESAWREWGAWLADHGLRMVVHRKLPPPRNRWIGVVEMPGWFNGHALVMCRDELLFDSAQHPDTHRPVRVFTPSEITYGISFNNKEHRT